MEKIVPIKLEIELPTSGVQTVIGETTSIYDDDCIAKRLKKQFIDDNENEGNIILQEVGDKVIGIEKEPIILERGGKKKIDIFLQIADTSDIRSSSSMIVDSQTGEKMFIVPEHSAHLREQFCSLLLKTSSQDLLVYDLLVHNIGNASITNGFVELIKNVLPEAKSVKSSFHMTTGELSDVGNLLREVKVSGKYKTTSGFNFLNAGTVLNDDMKLDLKLSGPGLPSGIDELNSHGISNMFIGGYQSKAKIRTGESDSTADIDLENLIYSMKTKFIFVSQTAITYDEWKNNCNNYLFDSTFGIASTSIEGTIT